VGWTCAISNFHTSLRAPCRAAKERHQCVGRLDVDSGGGRPGAGEAGGGAPRPRRGRVPGTQPVLGRGPLAPRRRHSLLLPGRCHCTSPAPLVHPRLVRLPRTYYPARAQHPLAPPRHLCLCLATRVPDHSVRSITVRGACGTLICRVPDQEEEACCRRVRAEVREAAEECHSGARRGQGQGGDGHRTRRAAAPSKGDDEDNALAVRRTLQLQDDLD
jgi:hypothetical protein